jgi:hypothetical protein
LQFIFGEQVSNGASPLRVNGAFDQSTPDSFVVNAQEYYEVRVMYGEQYTSPIDGGVRLSDSNNGGSQKFKVPVTNTGSKTFPGNYDAYANQFVYQNVAWDGCAAPLKLFVGPRRESFALPLGRVFDLVNLNPVTSTQQPLENSLDRFQVTTLAVEIPIACLTRGGASDGVVGTWASVRQLVHKGANEQYHFAGKQVSRLANPLVNELLIGLADKNHYSASHPSDDEQFLSYLQAPALPVLLQAIFNNAVVAPAFKRNDLVGLLFTGVPGVNKGENTARKRNVGGKPGAPRVEYEFHNGDDTTTSSSTSDSGSSSDNSDDDDDSAVEFDSYELSKSLKEASLPQLDSDFKTIADMLRLSTSIPGTPASTQNPLGLLADDLDGYPNGRRLGDDVVDISLRAVMGVVCHSINPVITSLGICTPADAPSGAAPLTDGVPTHACSFGATFPYLNAPVPGDVAPTDAFPSQFDNTC